MDQAIASLDNNSQAQKFDNIRRIIDEQASGAAE